MNPVPLYRSFRISLICLLAVAALAAAGWTQTFAQRFDTSAPQAMLMDADTGTILLAKEIDAKIPPASLAKLMTMEVVFNRLKEGSLTLTDKFFVSENAWRKGGANSGGSTMFAKLNSEIELENLIKGVIVQSANDGCIVIAEGLAGTEETFADLMNERARRIGLKNSHFTNSTGLPDENQYVSIGDLARLAQHIIREYPEYYRYYSLPEFEWNGINQRNRNPLLGMSINADGMKTGYTEASGYAIVGSAVREGQRLITVLSGMTSAKERAEEARKILDWGFRAFERLNLFDAEAKVGEIPIYGGKPGSVEVTGGDSIEIYLPVGNRDRLRARIAYDYPVMPPVKKGDRVATLKVWIGDDLSQETPLYAMQDSAQGGIMQQATDALTELLTSWIPR
ncbi:D-alanyl-D-alanine carboxypeptidase family protein [Salaquimonas pukyongi]|uniref:D-alanyl-D-alanine carboxypeptidase family protein n=1 Tax=Salaquimonas pukyongi TaxID=2712698 RepID=UPI001FCDBBAC|nr:D-alanyl-D-alanine carboxypeptidase family protein [Salaquimonas pukyongi]